MEGQLDSRFVSELESCVSVDSHNFLLSYTPWCKPCMDMMPLWDQLALEENPKGRTMVAKINCERHERMYISL